MSKPRTCRLKTPFENTTESRNIYPRPQLERDSFMSLCGEWELSVTKDERTDHIGSIRVPFPPESALSGIERALDSGEHYIYERSFTVDAGFVGDRVLLHFGAVDQIARVTLNGTYIGEHTGGYLPFTFEVTKHIKTGENRLKVEVTDELDTDIPYGKQRRKRGGMWYTPISGIWQPVWLESVPENYIKSLRITPGLDCVTIEATGGTAEKLLKIETPNGTAEHRFTGNKTVIHIDAPIHWTPENPYLYRFTLTSGSDTVRSYFALRTVTVEKANGRSYIALNGKPYFFNGLLDQGYYSDGIYLPASPEGYLCDIKTMKSLGFNMLRKHIKVEPELFYYYCDLYGMVVFQDMVNNGKYNFIIDTALPTIGLKRGITHRASERRRELFESEAQGMIEHLYNHPCVCYYTIFNEGWGQYDADSMYEKFKALDPSRIFDTTSGWFKETKSDVKSEHVYFKKLDLTPDERPLVLSEFGGYSCKIEGHSFNLDKTYGYRFFTEQSELMTALESLYLDEVVPMIQKGLSAAVLTQVSDVEDETNGLFTYDRQVLKVDVKRMQAIADEVYAAFKAVTE
nr:glycoside hydrolase family 2 [Clostridia bacterium]